MSRFVGVTLFNVYNSVTEMIIFIPFAVVISLFGAHSKTLKEMFSKNVLLECFAEGLGCTFC